MSIGIDTTMKGCDIVFYAEFITSKMAFYDRHITATNRLVSVKLESWVVYNSCAKPRRLQSPSFGSCSGVVGRIGR
jgi:hypothetical protein